MTILSGTPQTSPLLPGAPPLCPACKGKGYTDEEDDWGKVSPVPCACRPDLEAIPEDHWLVAVLEHPERESWAAICADMEAN